MISHKDLKTFDDWQRLLRQMHGGDLNNFFHLSFDEHREYCTKLNFLMAVADRFLEVAYFEDSLSEEARKGYIDRSESVAEMIRKIYRDRDDIISAFEKAYSASHDYCGKFGFGTAAFGLSQQVVDPNKHIFVVSKVDAAQSQLDLAIERYHHCDWIGAVTLAGAAEECLPHNDDLFSKMLNGAEVRDCGKKEILSQINRIRNWLKHSDKEHPRCIEISRTDAAIMVLRAMTRFHACTGEQTPTMDRFEKSFRESYPQFLDAPPV